MKWLTKISLALCLVITVASVVVYTQLRNLSVEQVTERVWLLKGAGGNVTVLKTGAGAVLVDSMTFKIQGTRIKALAEELTGEPVAVIINTHFHLDHSHGNPAFDSRVEVISTSNTLHHLTNNDPIDGFWQAEEASELLPNIIVDSVEDLVIGDQTIRLLHPGRGHTNGDLVALLVEQRVIVMGDLLFNQRYPNIDLEHGGSVAEWPASLDRVLQESFDHAVPGHGELTNAAGIRQFQRFMQQLVEIGQQAKAQRWDLETTLAQATLTEDSGYETSSVPLMFTLDRQFVISRAWDDAFGAFTPKLVD